METVETSTHRMLAELSGKNLSNTNTEGQRIVIREFSRVPVGPIRNLSLSPSDVDATSVDSMSLAADAKLDYQFQFKRAVAIVADELIRVERLIRDELTSHYEPVCEMLAYVGELGGKRLRPSLLLLSARAAGGLPTEEALRLAVVVELVHTATLVHDDILDNATLRRHKNTLHSKWNVPASVLTGDWLFTQAYYLANQGTSTTPGQWIANAAKRVCEGEIMQGRSIRNYSISELEYLDLLEAKTGALCAVSCALGAWSTGASAATCRQLHLFGMKLGTAFQVFDDWLDVWGNADKAGKTLGTDLANFKPTLPTIFTLSQMPDDERARMIQELEAGDLNAVATLRKQMDTCGASNYTLSYARSLIHEAIECLVELDDSPALAALRTLAIAAVERCA